MVEMTRELFDVWIDEEGVYGSLSSHREEIDELTEQIEILIKNTAGLRIIVRAMLEDRIISVEKKGNKCVLEIKK